MFVKTASRAMTRVERAYAGGRLKRCGLGAPDLLASSAAVLACSQDLEIGAWFGCSTSPKVSADGQYHSGLLIPAHLTLAGLEDPASHLFLLLV